MAFSQLNNKETVKILANDIAPATEGRNGGYLRIIRAGIRHGDAAEMADIELVDFNPTYKKSVVKRSSRRRRKKTKTAADTVANPQPAAEKKVAEKASEVAPAKQSVTTKKEKVKDVTSTVDVPPVKKAETLPPGKETKRQVSAEKPSDKTPTSKPVEKQADEAVKKNKNDDA